MRTAIGYEDPPEFPVTCMTDELPPRRITLLGTAGIDPDVWVAEIEGEERKAWVVKGTGGICHPTADVLRHHALPWPKPKGKECVVATIETKLRPWNIPNYAIVDEPPGLRQEGMREARTIPVSELPADTLRAMAHEWLIGLYDKAGKPYDWRFD